MNTELKNKTIQALCHNKELYAIISGCTNMPFVACDSETYEDEILMFFELDEAKKEAGRLNDSKNPVQIAKLEPPQYLGFYSMLYTIGVDCIFVNKGTDRQCRIALQEIVTRKSVEELPEGAERIENPQLHLTSIYLMQKVRAGQGADAEAKELQEEMLAHFKEGRYLVPVREGKGIPMLQLKEGGTYQPIFTDRAEFTKFNRENIFKSAVVEFESIAKVLPKEAAGVVVNPLGVNVQFQISRNQTE